MHFSPFNFLCEFNPDVKKKKNVRICSMAIKKMVNKKFKNISNITIL